MELGYIHTEGQRTAHQSVPLGGKTVLSPGSYLGAPSEATWLSPGGADLFRRVQYHTGLIVMTVK